MSHTADYADLAQRVYAEPRQEAIARPRIGLGVRLTDEYLERVAALCPHYFAASGAEGAPGREAWDLTDDGTISTPDLGLGVREVRGDHDGVESWLTLTGIGGTGRCWQRVTDLDDVNDTAVGILALWGWASE